MDPIFAALRVDVLRSRARLPRSLRCLADVAWNLAWSWLPDGIALFRDIDSSLWESSGHNPRSVLERGNPARIAELAIDPVFVARAEALHAQLQAYMAQPVTPSAEKLASRYKGAPVAYFSAEFGIHESLPIYSGGLGVLAGDHLKSSSDLGLPLVGVGLRYQQGYFHQSLDSTGWQQESYRDTDFGILPVGLILKKDGSPVTFSIPFRGRQVTVQLWGVQVGRIPLLLLDTNRDDNDPIDRWITGHLYGGDRDTRLAQEMILGIGGVRALHALGYEPAVFHMNEGHAAFLGLELVREGLSKGQIWEEAINGARSRTVFTTHTPVPAGHDSFTQERINSFMSDYLHSFQDGSFPVQREKLLALGRRREDDVFEDFGMTPLAIRTSRSINGVSELHGAVAREMWHPMWPEKSIEQTPIGHVTNGIHTATWLAPLMRLLFEKYLGKDWERHQADPRFWDRIDSIPDEELWQVHCQLKERTVAAARERVKAFRIQSGESAEYIGAAETALDPEALTFGFARRVATYKRLSLLLHDAERALSMLNHPEKPVQFIISGKSHPGDSEAKRLIQFLFRVRFDPRVQRRAVFLVDYNMSIAREMVHGVDVWLNLPRRPMEASGTSGMKAAMNGVLNCSVLDGWWAEGYDGGNGWSVGVEQDYADASQQDAEDAESLYSTLEDQIIPLYFNRDARGVPVGWVQRMKQNLKTLLPVYNTQRMVSEYVDKIYAP